MFFFRQTNPCIWPQCDNMCFFLKRTEHPPKLVGQTRSIFGSENETKIQSEISHSIKKSTSSPKSKSSMTAVTAVAFGWQAPRKRLRTAPEVHEVTAGWGGGWGPPRGLVRCAARTNNSKVFVGQSEIQWNQHLIIMFDFLMWFDSLMILMCFVMLYMIIMVFLLVVLVFNMSDGVPHWISSRNWARHLQHGKRRLRMSF